MTTNEQEPLRALLRREVQEARKAVLSDETPMHPDAVARLEALARLVELCDQTTAQRRRWPPVVLAVLTLSIVSVLLFARVSRTAIELDLAVSEAGFALAARQAVTDVLTVSQLGVAGLREARLPRGQDGPEHWTGGDVSLRLVSPGHDGRRAGTISLAPLVLEQGTRVWFRHADGPASYRLLIVGADDPIRVDLQGPVDTGRPLGMLNFSAPRSLVLEPSPDGVDFDLAAVGPSTAVLSSALLVDALSLDSVDEFTDPGATLVRRTSTIHGGAVYLRSLNGATHPLLAGEFLEFDELRGYVHGLELEDEHLRLRFEGDVAGMRTGRGDTRYSLMPTYLEWLKARHGVSLLWGTTLYLFGVAAGMLKWWGIRL